MALRSPYASESSGVEATFYRLANDGLAFERPPTSIVIATKPGGVRRGEAVELAGAQISKTFDAGRWTLRLKSRIDLSKELIDDDWVDLVGRRHDRRWHVMRGLIDDVRPVRAKSQEGAETWDWIVTGRDHTKVLEQTPVWFDRLTDADYAGAALNRILDQNLSFLGNVPKTVDALLFGFLIEENNRGRATWELPPSMPLIGAGHKITEALGFFAGHVRYSTEHFKDDPPRSAVINPVKFDPQNQSLWNLAQSFSDPPLVELYCDLLAPTGGYLEPHYGHSDGFQNTYTPEDTQMAIILRDRPFPTFARTGERLEDGPWYRTISTHLLRVEEIVAFDVARTGQNRRNAFFAAPALLAETAGLWPDLQIPLAHREDIKRHGMRRMDVYTNYIATTDKDSILTMAAAYRSRVRDFHCLQHLFYNGTIGLGHGRPDIRIGSRLRIEGPTAEDEWMFYVDGVDHAWSVGPGLRTTVHVTRGWNGDETSHVRALRLQLGGYNREDPADAAALELPLPRNVA